MSTPRIHRDPRRLFTPTQKHRAAQRQGWLCSECGQRLPDNAEGHHYTMHSHGGLTDDENLRVVCPPCHRTAETRPAPEFTPREWQSKALRTIGDSLADSGGFATCTAAAGAGKTIFAAMLFRRLQDAGIVDRLAVFVPSDELRVQWSTDKAIQSLLGVYLQPSTSIEDESRYSGVVNTYHALTQPKEITAMRDRALESRTLYVFDEVHHLALKQGKRGGTEASSWAMGVDTLVGTPSDPLAPVLNLTGTLFRSRPDERISTVDYDALPNGQIEARSNYSITSEELIGQGVLRPISLIRYDVDMTVTAVNIAEYATGSTMRSVDLDATPDIRREVLAKMYADETYVRGMLQQTIGWLASQSETLGGYGVKALVVTERVEHAKFVYRLLVEQIGPAAAFIAYHGSTDRGIEEFRNYKGQGVLVVVQKGTEGFDVPDVCVLTYLKSWTAPVFINQLTARAMRVTKVEKDLESTLTAIVILPAEPRIADAFGRVLAGPMNLAAMDHVCDQCGETVCVCRPVPLGEKECRVCGMPYKICACTCTACGETRYRGCRCPRTTFSVVPQTNLIDELTIDGALEIQGVNYNGDEVDTGLLELLRRAAPSAGITSSETLKVAGLIAIAQKDDPFGFAAAMDRQKHTHDGGTR